MVKTKKSKKEAAPPAPAEKPEEKAAPEPEKEAKEEEVQYVVSLGTKKKQTHGRNKSGMPWKKSSGRSVFHKKPNRTFEERQEEKERIKRI